MSPDTRYSGISRKWFEAAGWVVLVTLLWGSDLLAKFAERDQFGGGKDDFTLIVEQVTSGAAALLLIPFVIRWLSYFPLRGGVWVPAIVGHTAGTAMFAAGHYALMVFLRSIVYGVAGTTHIWREPFFANLIVEYQKDIKIYLGIVAVVVAYRLFIETWQRDKSTEGGINRLVVQTGTGTTILQVEQIDYLEAARNYIAVHALGREYLVRETLSNIVRRLPDTNFIQSHRSYIVNVNKIREIRSTGSSHEIVLQDDSTIPLSRGFRDRFRASLGSS